MSHFRLVECVPNFSEGQNREVIDAIAQAIAGTEGCSLLDVDAGVSTNRTVYTFVGSPEDVVEGALNGAKMARQLIDMTQHRGEHPRLGALDVCPFIPIRGVTVDDCVECANRFAERAAQEIGIPVYLYGFAAHYESRKTVPAIRTGEYEGLVNKIYEPVWKPDYGPAEFIPTWGATIAGARKFLIAYNVNILGTKEQAHRIALNLREHGRGTDQPGRLQCVQGMGWWLQEANIAQVSMNLGDLESTPMHIAFEEVVKDAKELNVGVCGSQIVGVVPLQAMIDAAEYYIKKENLFIVTEDQKIRLVIERLGLSSIHPFDPKARIIDYMVSRNEDGPLISLPLKEFILSLGARTSAPGGGSASAAVAAMGAALGTMVGWMSHGNKKFEHLESTMRRVIPDLRQIMLDLIPMVDADTCAFNHYMEARKLPHKSPEEAAIREEAMQKGLEVAIQVPVTVVRTANKAWPLLTELAKVGNINTKSDLQVGVRSLETGIWGAYHNIMINMADIKDEEFKAKITQEAEAAVELAQEKSREILQIAADRKE